LTSTWLRWWRGARSMLQPLAWSMTEPCPIVSLHVVLNIL
jgi:hypothetical protein